MKPFSSGHDNRTIYIEIDDNFISFYFESAINYFNSRQQYLADNNIEPNEDEPKEPTEFYWIPTDEWISDRTNRQGRGDNWFIHMREKNWFTKEMEKFIDENVK